MTMHSSSLGACEPRSIGPRARRNSGATCMEGDLDANPRHLRGRAGPRLRRLAFIRRARGRRLQAMSRSISKVREELCRQDLQDRGRHLLEGMPEKIGPTLVQGARAVRRLGCAKRIDAPEAVT